MNNKNLTKKDISEAIVEALNEINGKKQKESFASDFLKFPVIWIFRIISLGLILLTIPVITSFIVMINDGKIVTVINWISVIFFTVAIVSLLILFGIYCWKIGTEIRMERDKNYVTSFFSAIVAIVALVISVIAYLN